MSLHSGSITMPPHQRAASSPGHRRSKRLPFRRRILIYPCDNPAEGKATAVMHDFSRHGIGFCHSRTLRSGGQFILQRIEKGGGRCRCSTPYGIAARCVKASASALS
jgi:hypothetical protein